MQSIVVLFVRLLAIYLAHSGQEDFRESSSNPRQVERMRSEYYMERDECVEEVKSVDYFTPAIVESQEALEYSYDTNVSCLMKFKPAPGQDGLIVAIAWIDTYDCNDVVEIIPERGQAMSFCGHAISHFETRNAWVYTNQTISIKWTSAASEESRRPGLGFRIVLSPFHLHECKGPRKCFKCDNGLYIDEYLHCGGMNPCGDLSGNNGCP